VIEAQRQQVQSKLAYREVEVTYVALTDNSTITRALPWSATEYSATYPPLSGTFISTCRPIGHESCIGLYEENREFKRS